MQRWLIVCMHARVPEEKRFIYLCVRFPRNCHRLIKWIRSSLFTNRSDIFFRRGCEVHRYITDRNRAHARIWGTRRHASYRNFCASEFCVWMFNGGFRTLLFTMATDLIKHRTRRAFRVASMELKHTSARSRRAVPCSCIFWSTVSCFLTEIRVILNLYFRSIDSADW